MIASKKAVQSIYKEQILWYHFTYGNVSKTIF